MPDQRTESLGKLVVLMDKLRSECPWDAKQTHTSLRPHLLEETYEVLEALDYLDEETGKGTEHLKEELGDLIFASLDVSRKLKFNPEEVLKKGSRKFINRWKKLERIIKKENKDLNKLNSNQLNKYWNLAKIN